MTSSTLRRALDDFRSGEIKNAQGYLTDFIAAKFGIRVDHLTIRQDNLSLNSINGTFNTDNGEKSFFKFHMEESEETVAEYYRAELLAGAGYPVETPLYLSKDVGEQILIYPYKKSERLADMCKRLESTSDSPEYTALIEGQKELDQICAQKAIETLKTATPDDLSNEPLLQLFYWRLVDTDDKGKITPGGRHHDFYVGKNFTLPNGQTLSYDQIAHMTWQINDIPYDMTLDRAFSESRRILSPDYYSQYAACTAHGDAHNGNVWGNKRADGSIYLSWFDPAFAGSNIPVLLAEVKTLFHNIFAHPLWLYDAAEADPTLDVSCAIKDNRIIVQHNWALSPLRSAFLSSKKDYFWIPVLKDLHSKNMLPDDWEDYVRSALFCCPTLVMNLRSGAGTAQNTHTPKTSLLGLSIAIMLASSPENGQDPLSEFFDEIRKGLNDETECLDL